MLSGRKELATEWMEKYAPDLKSCFRVYNSYQYLTERKIYLQNEMYSLENVTEAVMSFTLLYSR
jgi:hypothetical protein